MATSYLSRSIESKVLELGLESLSGHSPTFHCDVLIVGSGYGGAVAAARLAGLTDADKPVSVWVLERGREFLPGDFPERTEQLPGQLRATGTGVTQVFGNASGLFDLRIGKDISVLAGNGLGGGSLINASVMEPPDPSVWTFEKQGQYLWPAEIRSDAQSGALTQYFDRARSMLGVQRLRKPLTSVSMYASGQQSPAPYPAKTQALEAVAQAISPEKPAFKIVNLAVTLDESAQDNAHGQLAQQRCNHCGNCFTGCNYSAKNTLDKNYLAVARRRGAQLLTGATVLAIAPAHGSDDDSGAGWQVLFTFTEPNLRKQHTESFASMPTHNGTSARGFVLRARRVILAAGAVGSTEILQKSRAWFELGLSDRLGAGFSGNGDMVALGYNQIRAVNPATDETIKPELRGVGPTIVSMIDLRRHEQHGGRGPVIQDVSVPAAMYPLFAEFMTIAMFLNRFERGDGRSFAQIAREEIDKDAIDPFRIAHTQLYAVFGHDSADGQIKLGDKAQNFCDSDGQVTIEWPQIRNAQGVAEFEKGLRYLRDAHQKPQVGGRMLYNPAWQMFGQKTAGLIAGADPDAQSGAPIAAHPLGGCAMADDRRFGVVNSIGQVFRVRPQAQGAGNEVYESLVVLDGATIAGSLGINPALTITSLAERSIAQLVLRWQLRAEAAPPFAVILPPPPTLSADSESLAKGARRPTHLELTERLLSTTPVTLPGNLPDVYLAIELTLGPIRDMGVFLANAKRRLPIAASSARLTQANCSVEFAVSGYVSVFEEVPTHALERVVRTVKGILPALWRRRTNRQQGNRLRWWLPSAWPALIRVASVSGAQRRFVYDMRIDRDVFLGGVCVLRAGDQLAGEKLFSFGIRSNPWEQFMSLQLNYQSAGAPFDVPMGVMRTDFSYFANLETFLLKVVKQGSRTTAMLELTGLLTLVARSLIGIHLLNTHAPDRHQQGAAPITPNERLPQHLVTQRSGKVAVRQFRLQPDARHPELDIICSRFAQPAAGTFAKPVLLLHGLTAAGNTFTSDALEYGLAAYLHDQGFDIWVAELRTSVALETWREPWLFDDVALYDIPALVRLVHEQTHQKINVFAHCIGAVMFWSSVLQGKLTGLIASAACTQVGLATRLPPMNNARNRLIGALREAVTADLYETNPSADSGVAGPFIERIYSSFPYQSDQWWRLNKPFTKRPWEAQYHRLTALHGELMNLRQVSETVLNDLHRQLGGTHLKTYMESLNFSRGLVTTSDGQNLVTRTALRTHVTFPCFFGAGSRNNVFETQNAEDSALLLTFAHGHRSVGAPLSTGAPLTTGATITTGANQASAPHVHAVFANYGHQDALIGKNAAREVFAPVANFFSAQATEVIANPLYPSEPVWTIYASTMGPTVGWLRKCGDNHWRLRVAFHADPMAGKPAQLLALFAAANLRRAKPPLQSIPITPSPSTPNLITPNPITPSPITPSPAIKEALEARWVFLNGPTDAGVDPNAYNIDIDVQSAILSRIDSAGDAGALEVFLLGLYDDEAVFERDDGHINACVLPEVLAATIHNGQISSLPNNYQANERPAERLSETDLSQWVSYINWQLSDSGCEPVRQPANMVSTRGLRAHHFCRPEALSRSQGLTRTERDLRFNPTSILLRREAFDAADLLPLTASAAALTSEARSKQTTEGVRLTFALASCQSMSLPFDQVVAGQSYERLARLLGRTSAPAQQLNVPQLLLLIGDQVYLDPFVGLIDAPTGAEKVRQPYQSWLQLPSTRRALRAVPTYMMLDDHEIKNEWEPAANSKVSAGDDYLHNALKAFRTYQRSLGPDPVSAARSDAAPSNEHFWYTFSPAGVPFFMLDTRTERSARTLFSLDQSTIISELQMQALLNWLSEQQRTRAHLPKFIVSPSVVLPGMRHDLDDFARALSSDGWTGYPASLERLFDHIVSNRIGNVVFLQGDYHASLVAQIQIAKNPQLADAIPVLSIVSSGLYAPYGFVNTPAQLLDDATLDPSLIRQTRAGSSTWYRCSLSPAMYSSDPNFVVVTLDSVLSEVQTKLRLTVEISTDAGPISRDY